MISIIRVFSVVALPVALFGCQTAQTGAADLQSADLQSADLQSESRTGAHALAQAACAGCHSIEAFGLSPNAAAPEFPMIANRRGLSNATLQNWLRNAHNYPEEMDFYLEDDEINDLVSYIMSLKTVDYHPPI